MRCFRRDGMRFLFLRAAWGCTRTSRGGRSPRQCPGRPSCSWGSPSAKRNSLWSGSTIFYDSHTLPIWDPSRRYTPKITALLTFLDLSTCRYMALNWRLRRRMVYSWRVRRWRPHQPRIRRACSSLDSSKNQNLFNMDG